MSSSNPPPTHPRPIDSSNDSSHQTSSSSPPTTNNLSPPVIAVIIIVPILATLLTILYWRRKVHRRTHLYANQITQPDHNPNAPHRSGAPRFIIPPGGTGADRPEGQRRTDRMRRLMNGINPRPSRSDSVRTVPQYSVDPQETEMTLAHAQRETENNQPSQTSFIMRFIGNHTTTHNSRTQNNNTHPPTTTELLPTSNNLQPHPHPSEPPPDYQLSTNTSTNYPPQQSSSNHPLPNSSSSSRTLLPSNLQGSSEPSSSHLDHETDHDPYHPQHHTLHLDRSITSSTSCSQITHKPSRRPSLTTLIHPTPTTSQPLIEDDNVNHQLRLPSGGVTPQQLSFLGRIGNLSRLGILRPSDQQPVSDQTPPPPAFDTSPPSPPSHSNTHTR